MHRESYEMAETLTDILSASVDDLDTDVNTLVAKAEAVGAPIVLD